MKYSVLSIIAHDLLIVSVSTVASKVAFNASGRVVNEKQCNLSLEAIEVVVCLKDLNLVDKRLHDSIREAAPMTNTENLIFQDINGFMIVGGHQKTVIKIFH